MLLGLSASLLVKRRWRELALNDPQFLFQHPVQFYDETFKSTWVFFALNSFDEREDLWMKRHSCYEKGSSDNGTDCPLSGTTMYIQFVP